MRLQFEEEENSRLEDEAQQPRAVQRRGGCPRASLQRRLMSNGRDFTSEDYEMLLELDSASAGQSRSEAEVLSLETLLTQLPVNRISGEGESVQCSICLELMVVGAEVRTLPCMHQFHCACIDRWLRMPGPPRCPV